MTKLSETRLMTRACTTVAAFELN